MPKIMLAQGALVTPRGTVLGHLIDLVTVFGPPFCWVGKEIKEGLPSPTQILLKSAREAESTVRFRRFLQFYVSKRYRSLEPIEVNVFSSRLVNISSIRRKSEQLWTKPAHYFSSVICSDWNSGINTLFHPHPTPGGSSISGGVRIFRIPGLSDASASESCGAIQKRDRVSCKMSVKPCDLSTCTKRLVPFSCSLHIETSMVIATTSQSPLCVFDCIIRPETLTAFTSVDCRPMGAIQEVGRKPRHFFVLSGTYCVLYFWTEHAWSWFRGWSFITCKVEFCSTEQAFQSQPPKPFEVFTSTPHNKTTQDKNDPRPSFFSAATENVLAFVPWPVRVIPHSNP